MTGIIDDHAHPVMGGLKLLYECNFAFESTPAEIADTVAKCAKATPASEWIRGGQWTSALFEHSDVPSPRRFLDAVSGPHPVMLVDDAEHNGWVNSAALALAGIDAKTPDPPGGRIVRDADGTPNGLLLESAFRVLFRPHLPDWSRAQLVAAVRESARRANGYGITAVKDAGAYEEYLRAYQEVDGGGSLTIHVAASLRTPSGARDAALDYEDLVRRRDTYATQHVDTRFVKIFLDGVPTSARTAAMLEPYAGTQERGELLVPADVLAADLVELDRRGFTVKMHAAGDRAVRVGLDAIAAARRVNGDSGRHHELAHAGFVAGSDIPRFAALDAIPDFSPVIWYPQPIIASIREAVGPRGEQYWPTRTLLRAGAIVTGGTDWPAAVADENPWTAIATLVTRRDPRGITPGSLWAEQAVSVEEALRIYTIHGARALRLETRIGTLEPGKSADIIILDRNPFEIPANDIASIRVLDVWFEGRRLTPHAHTHP